MTMMASIGGSSARFSIARVIVVVVAVYLMVMGFAKDTVAGRLLGFISAMVILKSFSNYSDRVTNRSTSPRPASDRAQVGHPNLDADHPLWDRWIDQ